MSRIPKRFLEKIQEARKQGLEGLELSGLGLPGDQRLTQIPAEVFRLKQLQVLSLRNNHLMSVPDAIAYLQNLTMLDLRYNHFENIPDAITQLQNLRVLSLSNNNLTAMPDAIAQLQNLTVLDLSHNELTAIPDAIAQLQNLTVLDLSCNRLVAVPDTMVQLRDLTDLHLRGNRLTIVPDTIAQLQHLTRLDLSGNRLATVPDTITQLRDLTWLDLSNNQITTVPEALVQLPNLRMLELRNNPMRTPPLEVVYRGLEAIRDYFRQLEAKGPDYLYEAKLLIVGEGGAGKTTLSKKIQNPNYQLREDEASTEGIKVIRWQFPTEGGRPFQVNIWDFGGQEIYHATHQFFLTKRSLYALVADTRKEDTDFYYWLNVVELLSDNSPLLIIKNEKQDRHREINERQLRGQFTNLKETLSTNLATNRGLPQVVAEIKHHISRLPHVGSALPKTWVMVREALERDPRNYISLEEFLGICQKNGFTQLKDKLQLSGYLHDLGVCLHFQDDPLLRKTVILKPQWGTDAVYKVLDNQKVIRSLGQFTRADLADIWAAPEHADMQDELLQLMMKFKLCYKIPGNEDTYIAPQLLTENQPDYDWHESDNLLLRYTYEFMPKGILTQFIVATHAMIADLRCVWKSGVVLEKDQTKAEVIEHYGRREIRIRVAGMHKKDLMTIVTYELDNIHASYKRLKYDKLIPCNCAGCKASQEPHFYHFEVLRKFTEDGRDDIQCHKSYEMVNVWGLVDDFVDKRRFLKERESAGWRAAEETPVTDLSMLHQFLVERLNDEELREICFELHVDYESLGGEGKEGIARELILYLDRRQHIPELVGIGKRLRPDIPWDEASLSSQ
jgi:GTPase SAR1 family protein